MKTIQALSFTPKYDELEDRIRVVVNYEDINSRVDFMMTRSFILKLFPTLEEYMIKFYRGDIEIAVITPEVMKEKIQNEESTNETDTTNLELYKTNNELLLEVSFGYVEASKKSIIKFKSANVEVVSQLDEHSIKQIFSMIKSVIPFFSWGISQHI